MRRRTRVVVFLAIVVPLVAAGLWVGWVELQRSRTEQLAETDVSTAPAESLMAGPHVMFRSTAPGQDYGVAAVVSLDDPSGVRGFTPVVCDRLYATSDELSCLVTERGVATKYRADVLSTDDWSVLTSWPLPGIPNRTRISDDGKLISTTSFVSGHSYASTGFQTATEIHGRDGTESGNLEEFTLVVDGAPVAPVDRNVWGVTFVDDRRFYATAQSASLGHTWLVEGDLEARTLTAVHDGVECPSLSPDGTRIAFKAVVDRSPTVVWNIGVLDLATGESRTLPGETRNVDDQVEWLDDSTLLYGMARTDEPGVTDVWSLDVDDADATAELFIPQAWSPAVVRP